LAQWYLEEIFKDFPHLSRPLITPGDHELNKIDFALYQEALV
jgi:hypothetical protein